MKKQLLISAMLMGPLLLAAQADSKYDKRETKPEMKGWLGLNLGISLPVGSYASTSGNNAGAAKSGAFLGVDFGYKLNANIGLTARLGIAANSADADAIARDLSRQLPGTSGSVKAGAWGVGTLMAGLYFKPETSPFYVRTMIGYCSVQSPSLDITVYPGGSTGGAINVKQQEATAPALAFNIGLGGNFRVGNKVVILTGLDFLQTTKANFKDVEAISSNGSRATGDFSQSVSMVNLHIGIGLVLD